MERDKIKKKKKKKVLNVSPVEEEEVVIKKKKKNKQTCSCPVRDAQESRKKKLKKKHRNEIVEEHQEIILENSVNEKRKKKKHKNEGLSEPLTEENESPGKKEKKKKKKENFRSDNEVDDSEIISIPKKKKHKKKHAEQADDSEIISTPKKKKRKNKHNEQNERDIDVELNIDKQEKDINEADESEIISTPKKKKRKKQHAEQVDDSEIISTPKKKKQKKKKREQNESDVSMVLPEEEAEENYVKEGKHKSKKKKKRDLENIIPEDESKGPDDVMKNYEKKKGSKRKPLTESTKVVERENGSGDGWRENGSGEPPTKKKKNKFNKETADHSCERDSHLILLEEEKNEKSGGSRPDSGDIVNCYSAGQADKKQEPSAAEVFVNAMDSIVIDSGDEVDVNVHQEESRQTNDEVDATPTNPLQPVTAQSIVGNISRFKENYANLLDNEDGHYLNDWHITAQELKMMGRPCHTGRWTQEELNILKNNIDNYKQFANISDFSSFINNQSDKISWVSLREYINRPIKAVQKKVLQIYRKDNTLKTGRYSQAEINNLISLQKIYGNNWVEIGIKMNRSAANVCDKFHDIKGLSQDQLRKITSSDEMFKKFSEAEDEQLKRIVLELSRGDDGKLDLTKVNWALVSAHVGTRTAGACRQRWTLNHQKIVSASSKKLSQNKNKAGSHWEPPSVSKIRLHTKVLSLLIDAKINEISDINWDTIFKIIDLKSDHDAFKKRFFTLLKNNKKDAREGISFLELLKFVHAKKIRILNRRNFSQM